ncbi:cytochrome c oxidase subunit 7A1, mitochondrial-like [Lethenteron reissneri]|uniref:cytochrome c oxidase subunit 7A1, mitochondrial-like n=1 Tax=Lethenteron reissneri TaxID=7753 RepID=UPI002AB7BD6D|nr:cytochrome c oxidase subunit 7A1, mitochondrial-like [Lethenteron reissneri]
MLGAVILKQCGRRVFSTSTRSNVNRVLEKQKLYQANDHPVHLKGGSGDRLLYMLTMGITVFGSMGVVGSLVWIAFPHNK